MIRNRFYGCFRTSRRYGLTLAEIVVSLVLVSVMMVAALNAVGASKLGQRKLHDRHQGQQLAQALMAEVLRQDYADSYSGPDSFGISPAEASSGNRSLFDDVDDYDGWSASPPERKDGTVLPNFQGWTRRVAVSWVNPFDVSQTVASNYGAKLITVTVTRDDVPAAELMAVRTLGPPETEACCLGDGGCVDLAPDVCTALGGEPQGAGLSCFTTSCVDGLLFVVDDGSLKNEDSTRKALLESWGYHVTLISDKATQAEFDAALEDNAVAYISGECDEGDILEKLTNTTVGVVTEQRQMARRDRLGLWEKDWREYDDIVISIDDNTHYVTSGFGIGALTILSEKKKLLCSDGKPSLGARTLAYKADEPQRRVLLTLEAGATLYDGSHAAGRRVVMPWGKAVGTVNITVDGLTLFQRAVEWAASQQ